MIGFWQGNRKLFLMIFADNMKEEVLGMDTMTILKIVFTALLCVPVFALSIHLIGKLMDEIIKNPGRQ